MRKTVVCILLLTLLLCGCQPNKSQSQVAIQDLGIPTMEQYSDDLISRCPWDMVVWNNKLYVGAGDYGANTGPVDCMAYDLQTAAWENSGTVLEESIARFCVVNNTLTIPGIDSTMDGHVLGEYYFLQEGKWQLNRTLPGGIHCFNLVEYNQQLFAGLGVTQGEYPVAVSADGGETFNQVPFYKDGQPLQTTKDAIRVYDLVVLNNTLYAFYISENNEPNKENDFECCVYQYQDNRFVYQSTWNPYLQSVGLTQMPFASKAVFQNQLYIATGYLYQATDSLNGFQQVMLEGQPITADLVVQEDGLYILNNQPKTDGTFDVSVWRTNNGEDFEQVLYFNYKTPALSFTINGETYFIGIGNPSLQHQTNGTILAVTLS